MYSLYQYLTLHFKNLQKREPNELYNEKFTGDSQKVNNDLKILYNKGSLNSKLGKLSLNHLINEPKLQLMNDLKTIDDFSNISSVNSEISRNIKGIQYLETKLTQGNMNNNKCINYIIQNVNLVVSFLQNKDVCSAAYYTSKMNPLIDKLYYSNKGINKLYQYKGNTATHEFDHLIIEDITNPTNSFKMSNIIVGLSEIKSLLKEIYLHLNPGNKV